MTTKICSRCKSELPHAEFGPDSRTKSGLRSRCRACENDVRRKPGQPRQVRRRRPARATETKRPAAKQAAAKQTAPRQASLMSLDDGIKELREAHGDTANIEVAVSIIAKYEQAERTRVDREHKEAKFVQRDEAVAQFIGIPIMVDEVFRQGLFDRIGMPDFDPVEWGKAAEARLKTMCREYHQWLQTPS